MRNGYVFKDHSLPFHDLDPGESHGTNIVIVMRATVLKAVRVESSTQPVFLVGFENLVIDIEMVFLLQVVEDHGREKSRDACTNDPNMEWLIPLLTFEPGVFDG